MKYSFDNKRLRKLTLIVFSLCYVCGFAEDPAPKQNTPAKSLTKEEQLEKARVNAEIRAMLKNTKTSPGTDKEAVFKRELAEIMTKDLKSPKYSPEKRKQVDGPTTGPPILPTIPAVDRQYAPKPAYPVPGPNDPPLHNTHDLVDAYLRAPNWEARLPYIYRSEELKNRISEYYRKQPDFSLDRFKMKLFQFELEKEYGGPFWVYRISTDKVTNGYPLIIREEAGILKVDWEVYSEFADRHFVKYAAGEMSGPREFRLVAEHASPDASTFKNIKGYNCYQIDPPYGGFRAHTDFAFVKKGTKAATAMSNKIDIGDKPLAVIIKLEKKDFGDGAKHNVITEFIGEGWFGQFGFRQK